MTRNDRAKPRLLIVGGEARNFGSKDFKATFDYVHVDKKLAKIPSSVSRQTFDAVVILRFIDKDMIKTTKLWADKLGIPYVESRSLGMSAQILSERVAGIREYLAQSKGAAPEPPKEPPKKAPSPALPLDEDTLWEAYGDNLVQYLSGSNGETLDRPGFVSLVESETGLKGDPVETLISLLRRQGVISETDGGVAIGTAEKINPSRRKEFIRSFGNGSRSPREEVREALSTEPADEPEKRITLKLGGFTDGDIVGFLRRIGEAREFKNMSDLFHALFKVGLKNKAGEPYSRGRMEYFLNMAKSSGARLHKTGKHSFKILLPGSMAPEPATTPVPLPPEEKKPDPKPPELPVGVSVPLYSLKAEAEPKAALSDQGFSKPGALYAALEATFPGKKIPDLVGLADPARALRSILYEAAWNKAAAQAILERLKLPADPKGLQTVLGTRLDFVDEEWSYFALEYFREKTMGSVIPMIMVSVGVYRSCRECEEDFFFNYPSFCRECKDRQRKLYEQAKGQSLPPKGGGL